MKLSDDEQDHSLKKDKKKKKRIHQDMALEDMDLDRINAELLKYGINPDDQNLVEEEPPQIEEQ